MNKKMTGFITFAAIVVMMSISISADAAVIAQTVELRGNVFSTDRDATPFTWNPQNFSGFYYDLKNDIGTETLRIDDPFLADREISGTDCGGSGCLIYETTKASMQFKVIQNLPSLTIPQYPSGKYSIIGWQGKPHVAVKDNARKLSKLIMEQGNATSDNKTLAAGDIWEMGDGYVLAAREINSTHAKLELSRNGIVLDNKTAAKNTIYTTALPNLANETDVLVFATYIDSIFNDGVLKVRLRYTWLISTDVKEINAGGVFGVMTVTSATTDRITVKNYYKSISLIRDSTVNIFGDLKFKVGNSDTLRFYPVIMLTAPGTYEVRGSIFSSDRNSIPFSWNSQNFGGLYYDEGLYNQVWNGWMFDRQYITGTENITINALDIAGREIPGNDPACGYSGCLIYETTKARKGFKVTENGKGIPEMTDGSYGILGWQGQKYVAVKDNARKLSKLIIEQGNSTADKKTLTVGETWDIGDGYTLTAKSIDAKASPRQVWLVLSKDGNKLDDRVLGQGEVYTYVEKSVAGETDVPVFVTFVDSVFAGANTDMVQLRFTWAISENVTMVNAGDVYGNTEVTSATTSMITAKNKDRTISLMKDATVDITGELKFKVADNDTLRFYPFITYGIPSPAPILPPQPFDTLKLEPNAWNLVSVPKTLNDPAVNIVLGNLSSDLLDMKWYYNASANAWESPSVIMPLRAYWVYNNATAQVKQKLNYKVMTGPNVPPSMTLKAGWNLIGHTSTQIMPVSSALVSIEGKYSHLLTYDPIDGWKMYIVGNPSLQEFTVFEPGRGYWIFMTQDATYAAVDI